LVFGLWGLAQTPIPQSPIPNPQSPHTIENKLRNKITQKNYILIKNNNLIKYNIEPNENFIPEDFIIIKQIGEGSFGKIYCSEWKKMGIIMP